MAEYNLHFDLQGNDGNNDASAFEFAPLTPVMGQSADWITPGYPPLGSVSGNTAAQPYPKLDLAPFVAAGSGGLHARSVRSSSHTCVAKDCHAPFRSARELEQHALEQKHQAFLCTCGKGYTKNSTLNRHIKEATELPQNECPCCEKSFKRPAHVETHLRTIHLVRKEAAIDALLRLQQAAPAPLRVSRRRKAAGAEAAPAPLRGSRRRKAAGAVAAANPINVPVTSSPAVPFPIQGLAGQFWLPTISTRDFRLMNTPDLFSVPASGFTTDPTGFPAPPMGYSGADMTGSVAAPVAEAVAASGGDDFLGELDFVDDMWF